MGRSGRLSKFATAAYHLEASMRDDARAFHQGLKSHTRKRLREAAPAVFLAFLTMTCACSRQPSSSVSERAIGPSKLPWGIDLTSQPGTTFKATYADNTVRIDHDTVFRTIRGVSSDHSIFIFENRPEVRDKLAPAKVALFEGLSFRKVQAIATNGSDLIVSTEDASFAELFKDADIKWHTPINFREIHARKVRALAALAAPPRFFALDMVPRWLDSLTPPVYAASEDQESGEKEEEGWKFKYDYKFNPDRLDFEVTASKAGEIEAEITGKGYIKNFETSMALTVQNSSTQHFDFSNQNVNGIVDFDWTVGSTDKPKELGEEKLKLPAVMSVPLVAGGVPMTLEIGEALLFHPGLTLKQEIAKGSFHVDYSGVTGLSVSSGSPENQSKADAETSMGNSTAFAPLAAFGVVVALALPRFELKTGAEELAKEIPDSLAEQAAQLLEKTTIGHFIKKAVKNVLATEAAAYFQVILSSTASHSGMLSLVPCQRFTLHVEDSSARTRSSWASAFRVCLRCLLKRPTRFS